MSVANPLPELTLPQMVREQAKKIPNKIALRQKDYGIWLPYTWQEYNLLARRFGMGLLSIGAEHGTRMGILSENKAEWVISQMGAGMVSCVAVGVYPTSPTPEVSYVVGHADVEVMVCEDQEQADKIIEAIDELPKIKKIIIIDMRGLAKHGSDLLISFEAFQKLGEAYEKEHFGIVDSILDKQVLDDDALMVYTSGSTGKPKGAVITYRNIRAGAWATLDRLALIPDSTALSYLPLCHVAEQLMTNFGPIYLGCMVSFGESIRTVQKDLREVGPSYFLGVPRIWEKLHSEIFIKINESGGLRKRIFDWGMAVCEPIRANKSAEWGLAEKLKLSFFYWIVFRALQNFLGLRETDLAVTGAAPLSPDVFRFFRTLGVPLVEAYGSTELSGVVTCHNADDVIPGTVGVPSASADIRLSEQGEILVAGEQVFKGYYKNDVETKATIVDGWFHTGDVAEWNGNQLKIVDRLKDIMITMGGKNLSPTEIESVMKTSPYIKECIIIGDRRKFVSALIQIDYESVSAWAEEKKLPFTTFKSLVDNPEVVSHINDVVAAGNKGLAPVANIRKFHLLKKELDHDDGEVTATMKIKRSKIYEKYQSEIEAMY